jgi:hypothetical protein
MPRFMMLMIPNIPTDTDWMPAAEDVAEMTAYNEELVKAGVLLDGQGLQPPELGFRVTFPEKNKAKITDGPFAEAKEVIGGYWIIQTKTREEAVEWARRIPGDPSNIVEVRQIFEMEDFPEDVQAAAGHPVQ